MSRELEWWGRLLVYVLPPFAVGFAPMAIIDPSSRFAGLAILFFVVVAMEGSWCGLDYHWKWHMRRGQREFAAEQDRKMIQENSVDQLADLAASGRFPFDAGKDWGSR